MTAKWVLLFGFVFVAACSTDPVARGSEVAAEVGCHTCHMDTDGDLAPSLNDIWGTVVDLEDGTVATVDAVYVRRSIIDPQAQIVKGYDGARMPTFSLAEEEVDQLVEYVRSLS